MRAKRTNRCVLVRCAAVIRECVSAWHDRRALRYIGVAVFMATLLTSMGGQSFAASSKGCDGGGFTLLGFSGKQNITIPAGSFGSSFLVRGTYIEFTVDAATLGVRNWTLTGAPNPLDITGGIRTPVFSSKLPDHR